MLYKCLSFTAAIVPQTAKKNAGNTYFKGTFMNIEDEWDLKDININFFPESAARIARLQEWADTNTVPNMQIAKVTVELPAFRMKDDDGNWREEIHTSLNVYVRMAKNPDYVPGKTVEFVEAESSKTKAIKTVESFGAWLTVTTDTTTGTKAPVAEVVAEAIVPPVSFDAPIVTPPVV